MTERNHEDSFKVDDVLSLIATGHYRSSNEMYCRYCNLFEAASLWD